MQDFLANTPSFSGFCCIYVTVVCHERRDWIWYEMEWGIGKNWAASRLKWNRMQSVNGIRETEWYWDYRCLFYTPDGWHGFSIGTVFELGMGIVGRYISLSHVYTIRCHRFPQLVSRHSDTIRTCISSPLVDSTLEQAFSTLLLTPGLVRSTAPAETAIARQALGFWWGSLYNLYCS